MSTDVVIVGNSLAGMVGVLALAESGARVVLVNPSRSWGGHFSGATAKGLRFDNGMIFYEIDAYNRQHGADLCTYEPRTRNDCGRFVESIGEFVARFCELRQAPDPVMVLKGREYPDLVITNRLDALRLLDRADRTVLEAEFVQANANSDRAWHASSKATWGAGNETSLQAASLRNHGRHFHEWFMEPVCRKILGVGCEEVLAQYHRVPWLPLFYPETLASQFGPAPQKLPETHFHYPAAGHSGVLVDALLEKLKVMSNVSIVFGTLGRLSHDGCGYVLEMEHGESIKAPQVVWAHELGYLERLCGIGREPSVPLQRASVGLAYVVVPRAKLQRSFSTMFVLDPELDTYRVSMPDVCAGQENPLCRVMVEFRGDRYVSAAQGIEGRLQDEIRRELRGLGVVAMESDATSVTVKILKNALAIPSAAGRTEFERQAEALAAIFPGMQRCGPAAGYFASSMNDQIVQGLRLPQIQGVTP